MHNKGPFDFFGGLILELGAVGALFFFLPQVSWDRLSAGPPRDDQNAQSAPISAQLFKPALASAWTRPSLEPSKREAPQLLPREPEAHPAPATIFEVTPVWKNVSTWAQSSPRRSPPAAHSKPPRPYQY